MNIHNWPPKKLCFYYFDFSFFFFYQNIRNRILTNQNLELVIRNCQVNFMIMSETHLGSHQTSFMTSKFNLSDDIKLNPGPKRYINQCFSVCHWNWNSVASHNFSKIQFLVTYNCIHKFDII